MINQFRPTQPPTLTKSPDASVFGYVKENVVENVVVDIPAIATLKKQRKKEDKPRNPAYAGMSEAEKKRAIRKAYYHNKGKVYHGINIRVDRFDMTKEQFNGCKTIEDLNDKVRQHLEEQKYNEKVIKSLMAFCYRGIEYTPYKPRQ